MTTSVASVLHSTGTTTFTCNLSGEANITVNRNRVKLYGTNVYLKNKQEFEIELFNPSTITKLAKIFLNGVAISPSGIVIKPGQRVYLERFIDSPQKFKFETYEAANTPDGLAAIANNGDVKVEFYDEQYHYPVIYHYDNPLTWSYSTGGTAVNYSNSFLTSKVVGRKSLVTQDSVETGRVEKGSDSSQSFTNYNANFNTWTSNVVEFKILPFSQKPVEIQQLAEYCIQCGTKNKGGSYKYCPTCGVKFG